MFSCRWEVNQPLYSPADRVLGSLSKPQQQTQDLHCVDTASGAFEADMQILQLKPDSDSRAENRQASCLWETDWSSASPWKKEVPGAWATLQSQQSHQIHAAEGSKLGAEELGVRSADGDPSCRYGGTIDASGILEGGETHKPFQTHLMCCPWSCLLVFGPNWQVFPSQQQLQKMSHSSTSVVFGKTVWFASRLSLTGCLPGLAT